VRKVFTFLVVLGCLPILSTLPASSAPESDTTALNLHEAYRTALRNNERLKAAQNTVKISGERITQARAALYPSLNLRAQQYRSKEPPTTTFPTTSEEFTWGADLSQPIYRGGQSWYGVNVQQLQHRNENLQYYREQQQILFEVASRFYEVSLANKNIEIAQNALKRAREQLQQARARHEVGKVTQNAILRAQVEESEAQQQLIEARNSRDVAREALAVELGLNRVPGRIQLPTSGTPEDTGLAAYQELSHRHRRDLRGMRLQLDSARERVKYQRADYYPEISLVGSYDNYEESTFTGLSEDWRVALQGSYPLFSGWRETSQVDEARYQYRIARQNYQRLKREIRRDVRQAYSTLTTQKSVVETLSNRVEAARRNYEEISAQFDEGLVDAVAVSDALTILNEAELRLAKARNTLRLNRLRLKLASGVFARDILTQRSMNS
jgi:outer membrane protein